VEPPKAKDSLVFSAVHLLSGLRLAGVLSSFAFTSAGRVLVAAAPAFEGAVTLRALLLLLVRAGVLGAVLAALQQLLLLACR
jgi:hypothetical protein